MLTPSCPPGWRTPTTVPILVYRSARLKRGLNIRDLNPLTYTLVDPDESVRARAQELLEEVLVRR